MLRPLVNERFQGLFHSPPGVLFTFPSRYSSTIGQTAILRPTQRSGRIHTGFHEARATRETRSPGHARSATGPSPSTARYPTRFASHTAFVTDARHVGTGTHAPTTPRPQPPTGITRPRFSHHPLSLATTHGVSSPAGTEMFHFPAYPPPKAVPAHNDRRVAPFGNPRIKAMSAAPRGLSRPHASFIGTVCQGIHHCALHHGPHHPARGRMTGHDGTQRTTRKNVSTGTLDYQIITHINPTPNRRGADTKQTNEHPGHPHRGAPCSKIAIRTTNHTPKTKGARPSLASTLQFSNHHHTRPPATTHTGPAAEPGRTGATTPTQGGVGGPGTQQHAPHHTPPQGGPFRSLPHQQGEPPATKARETIPHTDTHNRAPRKTP